MPKVDNAPGWSKRIEDARREAMSKSQASTGVGPEWPKPDAVDIETALSELTMSMYLAGLKVGCGVMNDGSGVWVRVTYPPGANDPKAGRVAFTVSDTLDKALRKAVQLLETDSDKVWKVDQFARLAEPR